jgi:hypothetical protein
LNLTAGERRYLTNCITGDGKLRLTIAVFRNMIGKKAIRVGIRVKSREKIEKRGCIRRWGFIGGNTVPFRMAQPCVLFTLPADLGDTVSQIAAQNLSTVNLAASMKK